MAPQSTHRAPAQPRAQSLAAPVMEVFSSVQGEGLHVGQPQVFLRLRGCPLRCRWCDTPGSWDVPAPDAASASSARLDLRGGMRREKVWATPFQVATWIAEVEAGRPRPVSVTGGEPLVWPEFVRALKPFISPRRLHLETAGGDPAALERVLDVVDHVSLDLKLPEDMDAPVEDGLPASAAQWSAARAENLELLARREPAEGRDAALKIVVTGGHALERFDPLFDDVASIAPELPVFLQPVTPTNGVDAPERDFLAALWERALERSLTVRVVPQVHRALRLP